MSMTSLASMTDLASMTSSQRVTDDPALLMLLVIVLGLGAVLGYLLHRMRSDSGAAVAVLEERLSARQMEISTSKQTVERLQTELRRLSENAAAYREQISGLQTTVEQERKQNQEKLRLLNDAREQMKLEFQSLAADILEDKSRRFTLSNKESISDILRPLNEKILQFEKKVEETYDRESKERFSLAREIQNLQELNVRISTDAVNLTRALKGENKTQGTWGEFILESILEKSGLGKGREYQVQTRLTAEDGSRNLPDVIVYLPENKQVIIDAKVSLTAYEAYCSADDEQERAEYLKQHITSIRNHVKGLSRKEYHRLPEVNSLDFVLLFMPVEAAFSLAVQHESELFTNAFEKNIVLVGPSTLLATLRTIQNIWRYEQQSRNAIEIASRAGALYDKFVAFVGDLEDVGSKLSATQRSYETAHNKLCSGRGNLIGRVEKLKQLGARASKKHNARLLAEAVNEELEELALNDDSVLRETTRMVETGAQSEAHKEVQRKVQKKVQRQVQK